MRTEGKDMCVRRRNVSEDSDDRLGTGRSSNVELIAEDDKIPAYVRALMRHFVDLRDNTHGGSARRHEKEDHFARAVELLRPVAGQILRVMHNLPPVESGAQQRGGMLRDPC